VPARPQARMSSLLGLVGVATSPSFVLRQALRGHPDTAVAFHYQTASSKATFRAGSAPAGAVSYTTNLHNGWRVQTFGVVAGAGIAASESSLMLFAGDYSSARCWPC